jgi:hypothetical protein
LAGFPALTLRLARASVKRSRRRGRTPRGFSAAAEEAVTRRIGGEIFSKVKTGMVNPSTLETDALGTGLGIPPGRIFESLHDIFGS